MSLDALKARMPAYAKDIKLNLSGVMNSTTLTAQQIAGTALASALATRNAEVIREINEEVADKLSDDAKTAAKAAAAIMAMNNIYYRSVHLLSNKEYMTMPAKLRMQIIGNPGVDKVDFELWSLAVSAVNGCGMCLESHEKVVLSKGASKEGVQDALRIAAVIHAAAAILDGEDALAG
ncbi:carboxymuconolactone decarboxylase family protein [Rhodovibrionaceae bacterium A322]